MKDKKKEVMDNSNNYIFNDENEYIKALPATTLIEYEYIENEKSISSIKTYVFAMIINYIKFFEKIIKAKFYIKSKKYYFSNTNKIVNKLINSLFKNKIVSGLYKTRSLPDEPKIISYYFKLNPITTSFGKKIPFSGSCGGCDTDLNTALMKGCAEAFERHSIATYKKDGLIKGTYNKLKNKSAVNPLKFMHFSRSQIENKQNLVSNYVNNTDINNIEIEWRRARGLFDNKKYLVPAQLCCIFYERSEKEPIIRQTTSNGAAAGSSLEHSVYSAFAEAIERDSLMIHYLNKLSPPQIDLNTIENPEIKDLINIYKRYNLELYILNMTTDIAVPSLLAVIIDRTGIGQATQIATKSDFDIEKTIFDIIYDGIRGRSSLRVLRNKKDIDKVNKIYPNIETISDRITLWSQPKMIEHIEFLTKGPKISIQEIKNKIRTKKMDYKQKLDKLKIALKSAGINEAYVVDVTSDIAKKNGIYVAMSLTPDLYPLYLNENYKYLGVKRLYDVPVKLGYYEKPKKENELNQIPHPMA